MSGTSLLIKTIRRKTLSLTLEVLIYRRKLSIIQVSVSGAEFWSMCCMLDFEIPNPELSEAILSQGKCTVETQSYLVPSLLRI